MQTAVAPHAPLSMAQADWVRQLEATFAQIARTRMAGLPVLNLRVRVQAVGFHARSVQGAERGTEPGPAEPGVMGVLVTPWFMNLLWRADGPLVAPLPVGQTRLRTLGGEALPFLGAFEPTIGAFEACSLISPMFQFADHATAVATATAVLEALRDAPAVPSPPPHVAPVTTPVTPPAAGQGEAARVAARRGFLFGRTGHSGPPATGSSR